MISKKMQDKFSLLIMRSNMKAKYAANKIADKHKLTVMAEMTLCLLELDAPVPMKSLSSFLGCDPSNVTGIIEQLVSEGLVERKEAEHDRRIKTVTLTKKGQALRSEFLSGSIRARFPNLEKFSDDEVEQFTTLLLKAMAANAPEGFLESLPV